MSAHWASARRRSLPRAIKWLRGVIPAWRGKTAEITGRKVCKRIVERTNPIHTDAAANGNDNPPSKYHAQPGADSVRRRLSTIFQRPIAGTAGARPVSH